MTEDIHPGPVMVVPQTAEVTLLNVISKAASDPATDVDKLERLMALYERGLAREAQMAFTRALALMQPELPEIEEHGEILNKQSEVQSTYALWEDTQAAIKPILARHGFALTFRIEQQPNTVIVYGRLSHVGGHVEETPSPPLPADTSGNKNAVQSWGSSVSYGMRYAARALLNLTSRGSDDDGQGGVRYIEAPQLEILLGLAAEAKIAEADLPTLAARFQVASLDQLPRHKYEEVRQVLEDRRKRVLARAKKPETPKSETPP